MSDQNEVKAEYNDGAVDAVAATVCIAIIISMVVFWLSGFSS